jgi:hypothetical protein
MSIDRIKIYGERNTGTNFLHQLIRANFQTPLVSQRVGKQTELKKISAKFKDVADKPYRHVLTNIVINRYHEQHVARTMRETAGWKHTAPPVKMIKRSPEWREKTLFVIVVKHPVFWLRSFKKRGYHNYFKTGETDFSEFLRQIYIPASIDNVRALTYDTIVKLYAAKVDAYRKLSELGVACELVRYETLIEDPAKFLDTLAAKFALEKKKDVYVIPTDSTKATDPRQLEEFKKDYALENVSKLVSPEDYAFIMSTFGKERLTWLGYEA